MPVDRSQVREGMTVHSSDGEKLGKVLRCDAVTFVVEKGLFFIHDYLAQYGDVTSIEGDDVRLGIPSETFRKLRETEEQDLDGRYTSRPVESTGYGLEGARWFTRPRSERAPNEEVPEHTGPSGGLVDPQEGAARHTMETPFTRPIPPPDDT